MQVNSYLYFPKIFYIINIYFKVHLILYYYIN